MSFLSPGWTPSGIASRVRSLWRALRRRDAIGGEMEEEFRHHIELRTRDLMRQGVPPGEARRRAHVEFGHVESVKEDARASMGLRGFDRLRFSWLDLKLGLRLLRKYPALSLVSTAGIAVAVAVGAVGFGVIDTLTASDLPLPGGDRLVTIEDQGPGGHLAHLHDLETWREQLGSVSVLGAYRSVVRNIVVGAGGVSPGRVVEMTSSGFDAAGVPPLLGRVLVAADERPGGPDVAVIGYGPWQTLFGGAPDVVGRTLRIGATTHTIVGVMPEGFAFPVNDRMWTPLRLDPVDFERGAAPPVEVFARLAPGATVDRLRVELGVVRDRLDAEHPDVYDHIRPTAYRYGEPLGQWSWTLHLVQGLVTLLLVVIAINVAALVYARTATRSGEIAVRGALGASRARIAWQLFAEGLVLSSAGALLGLALALWQLRRIDGHLGFVASIDRPFWWSFDVTPTTVLYVVGLAVLSALIIGVIPALGATGRRLRQGLQNVGARAPSPGLGRVWTALIIGQVVLAVAVLPVATNALWQWGISGLGGREQAVGQIVSARLHLDPASPLQFDPGTASDDATTADPEARYSALQAELLRRLEDEPDVARVVEMRPAPWEDPDLPVLVADRPPAEGESPEDASTPSRTQSLIKASYSPTMRLAGWSRVEPEYFPAMGIRALAGRLLQEDDARADAPVVVVSETFVQRVLDGAPALGRWVRLANGSQRWTGPVLLSDGSRRWGLEDETWYRIVGVVPDFPRIVSPYPPEPKVYQALPHGVANPLTLGIRLRGAQPERFERRLDELAAGIDPLLRVESFSLDARLREDEAAARMMALVIAALALSILLLAVAGLYALVSFTVTRRRREIGIRSALGGRPERILGGILSGVAWRLAVGVALGLVVAWLGDATVRGELMAGRGAVLLPAVALLVIVVGLLAAWGPLHRALRVQLSEVLQAE